MADARLRFRLAEASDLATVLDTLTESARWVVSRGFPNPWPIPFPGDQVRPSMEQRALFLVEGPTGTPIGTVTLQWEDPRFWGPRPPDAGYLHRLAVRRAFAGEDVGTKILAWAAATVREHHRTYLRLDCLRSAEGLHRFYAAHGFLPVGEVTVEGFECTLFERPVDRP